MRIRTRHLGGDVNKAADEALDNAVLLATGGYFAAAREIALAMLAPGPWQVGTRGALIQRLEDLVPWLSWLCGTESPAVGSEAALDRRAVETRATDYAQQELEMLVMADRVQEAPAGEGWSDANLARLAARGTAEPDMEAHADFLGDALWVLKSKAGKLAGAGAPSVQNALFSLLGLGSGAILVAPEAMRVDDESIARVLEAHSRASKLFSYMDSSCWTMLAALALQEGKPEVAARRLATALALGMDLYGIQGIRHWKPWRDLIATHALAPALGIDPRGVEAYLGAFRAREPQPARASSHKFSWNAALQAYAERHPDGAEAGWVEEHEPASGALLRMEEAGKVIRIGATEAAVAGLQKRLGEALPPSYAAFLRQSDGLLVPDGAVNLLPAAEVDWLVRRNADLVDAWNETGGDDVADEQYFTYGPDQDCIWMRSSYLRTALQVSDVLDGDVILLNPRTRFGDEWEAWYFGVTLPGARRYRSFEDLMREEVFEK